MIRMQIAEQLHAQFLKNGYQYAASTGKEYRLFYQYREHKVILIHFVDVAGDFSYDKQQLSATIRQAEDLFFQKGYSYIESLTIIVSADLHAAKEMCVDFTAYWIIDAAENRLLIYENQPGDYYGLKSTVEQALIFRQNSYQDTAIDFLKNRGIMTLILVLINIIMFVIITVSGSKIDGALMLKFGAMVPEAINNGEWYRLLTSVFLHWNIGHLANNMLVLLLLGDMLERYVGKWAFLFIYLMSGVGGNIISAFHSLALEHNVISAGASGAVFGVMGGLVCIVILNKGKLENLTTRKIMIFSVLSLYQGFTSQGIDNAAHVGGILAGAVTALLSQSMIKPRLR